MIFQCIGKLLLLAIILCISNSLSSNLKNIQSLSRNRSEMDKNLISKRISRTESPYIEDVLDNYCNMENLTILALGSSYWNPPIEALNRLTKNVFDPDAQRYGNIEGRPNLRERLTRHIENKGLCMDNLETMVTGGANQAFLTIALTLLDNNDNTGSNPTYLFQFSIKLIL